MILTHGANSLKRKGVSSILYLTDFTNFDSVNKEDRPLVGQYKMPFGQVTDLSFQPVTLMGTEINSVKWYHADATVINPMITVPDECKQISIEYFLSSYYPGDYGTNFSVGYLRFGGTSNGYFVKLFLPGNSEAVYNFYNNARLNNQWGKWCELYVDTQWYWHFYSCVVDFETSEIYLYIDGLLRAKVSNITLNRILQNMFDTHRTDHWINLAQCAIFSYAKNSADKSTYEVPQSPYVV